MKFAIISDIHSNLEAYCEVLSSLKKEPHLDRLVILGDIVGYGANPNECVEITRVLSGIGGKLSFDMDYDDDFLILSDCQVDVISGNHDWAVIGKLEKSYFNKDARRSISWTDRKLSTTNSAYLESIPLTLEEDDIVFTHSSTVEPQRFKYILNDRDAEMAIDSTSKRLVFVGHSHIPNIFIFDGRVKPGGDEIFDVEIADDEQAVINVGSVGQPRDSDPRASYCIYDKETGEIKIERIEYDYDTASEKILKTRLPRRYGERILWGI